MYLWRKHVTNDWLREHCNALITRHGGDMAIVERPEKRAVVEVVSRTRKEALVLQAKFGGGIEKLGSDWLKQFAKRSYVKPLRIGSRQIVIPAEAAFGTGEHATTAMCLRMLQRMAQSRPEDWSLLDAGTGTGILAIAGSFLGAKRIVAIDNDPVARSTAQRNARRNRVRNIEFRTGDVLKQRLKGKFDVITANLFSEILIAALPICSPHLADNGRLIVSGVLRSQEGTLVTALRRNSFQPEEIRRRGKWIALLACRVPGK
jgi:ribosomal protein L11 methyltransferase